MANNTPSPTVPHDDVTEKIKKPKKPKGPIRWEAVGPFTIFVLLIWAYFFFFFDLHLRHALQYAGTQGNGAEVDIGSVRTSFWNASLDINDIQVTDATEPTRNKIQIGKMTWKMLWDAVLRGKIAIEEASINSIAVGVPRTHPGLVLPPPPPPKDDGKPSAFAKAKDEALGRAQEEFSKNVLGDTAALLGGADPTAQLKNIEGSLKSSQRVKELQADLDKKQKEWKDRIDKLPQQKDIQAIDAKLKSVKLDHFNSPMEVQQSVQQIDAIIKEIDAKVKEVDATQKSLTGDVGTYQNSLKDLEGLVQQDVKDLEARVKLPKLDVATLSRTLFGPLFLDKVKKAEFYMAKAREYAPPKKSKDEKAEYKPPTPHEREKGRNYHFGAGHSYPMFWLKKAQISSRTTPGATWSGDIVGTLQDITNDSPLVGRPMLAVFKGDFPQQNLMGVNGKITIDHVTETPIEKFAMSVASYPLEDRALVNSPDVKLGIENASGSTSFEASLSGPSLKITSESAFQRRTQATSAGFLTSSAQQPILADILKGALASVPRVTVNAGVTGTWTDMHFDIDSNLGRDLAQAFEKQIQAKIAEARAKLQNFLHDQVGKQKEQLMGEFNKAKGQVDQLMKQKEDEVNKAKGGIEKAKNDALNSQKKGVEQQGQKALDDLKKKFKF